MGTEGDGWNVFFDPAYTRVFSIFHHGNNTNNPAKLMCRILDAAATACTGYPITLTQTSQRSTAFIDPVTSKLWHPTVTLDNKLAWDCVNVNPQPNPPTRCATPVVLSEYAGGRLMTAPATITT